MKAHAFLTSSLLGWAVLVGTASAVPRAIVCVDERGRVVDCPQPDERDPEGGPAAKRTWLKSAGDGLKREAGDQYVVIADGAQNRLVVSPDHPVGSGAWRYYAVKGASEFGTLCRGMDAEISVFHLVIENESDETLQCTADITIRGSLDRSSRTAVIEPRDRQLVAEVCTFSPELFSGATAMCAVREPAPPWVVPEGCSYKVIEAQPMSAMYPAASRRLVEQGPVDVGFRLSEKEGTPAEVVVVQGSGSLRLDDGAIRYVQAMRMQTECPGVRYRMKVQFRLGPKQQPVETGPLPVAVSD